MKNFLGLLISLAFVFTFQVHAETQAMTQATQFGLNRASLDNFPKYQMGDLMVTKRKWVQKGTYDFAVSGGAVGTLNLLGVKGKAITLPKGAIVSDCILDFRTATTSGGAATISVGTGQATNDLKSALAVASGTGLVSCIPVGSAATSIKMTADRSPTISIAAAALTAGKLTVLIEYWLSDSP